MAITVDGQIYRNLQEQVQYLTDRTNEIKPYVAGTGITISEQTISIDSSINDKITEVEGVATTANSNATAAQNTANAANATATQAQSRADSAYNLANTANTASEQNNAKIQTIENDIDAANAEINTLNGDLSTLSLGVHTDGLVYIFINGKPVGTGVEFVTAGDVVGYVDDAKNIVITGDLADGTYTLKYENQDGSTTEIGTLVIGSQPSYINLVPEAKSHTDLSTVFNSVGYMNGARPSSATPFYSSASGYVTTGCFQCTFDSVFYIKGVTIDTNDSNCRLGFARDINNAISPYSVAADFTNYATLETLGEQYYKVTFKSEYLQTNCPQLAYFFFGGIGSGENLIVSTTPIE